MTAPVASGGVAASPSNFLGVNSLTNRATPASRTAVIDKSKVDPKTREAAEGMEAMFLDYMMKVMRETVPKNDMDLESPATKIYRGMLDSEFARTAVRTGGIGLAEQIIAYLEANRYNNNTVQSAPPRKGSDDRTGGTHAGQPIDSK